LSVACFFSWVHTQDWRMEVWYKLMEENLGKEFADLVVCFREKGFKFDKETIINDEELDQLKLGGSFAQSSGQGKGRIDEKTKEEKVTKGEIKREILKKQD